jgi:NAD(P)-dependent dehydrogenase (short-subunit alcohol dehydrogenase family)
MGRAMVLGFAASGADVIVVSRKLAACQDVAAEVEAKSGRQAMAYACHVGHWDEMDGLVDAAYSRFGRIDVLVNNAGMSPLYPDPASLTEELYDKVLDVNLKGPFRLSALVGTRMVAGTGGSIINVSSHSVVRPDPDSIPYSAAKAGIHAMTVAFAHAFGPTVRVNCIQPGAFLTDISKSWDFGQFERYAETFALGRAAHPDEIVGTAIYLASDASGYTTGAVLAVDGGIA